MFFFERSIFSVFYFFIDGCSKIVRSWLWCCIDFGLVKKNGDDVLVLFRTCFVVKKGDGRIYHIISDTILVSRFGETDRRLTFSYVLYAYVPYNEGGGYSTRRFSQWYGNRNEIKFNEMKRNVGEERLYRTRGKGTAWRTSSDHRV